MTDPNTIPTLQDIEDSKLAMDDIQKFTYPTDISFIDSKNIRRITIKGLDAAYTMTAINSGVWAAGQIFTAVNQYMIFGTTAYKPKNSTTLPYVIGATPDTNFVEVVGNLSLSQADSRYQHTVDNTTGLIGLSPVVGESVKTLFYGGGGIGGASYLVVSVADNARNFVALADHVFANGNIARYIPDNTASIPAEQCGVTYGGVGVIETAELQAAVDVARAIQAELSDTDGGFEVQVNGRIRIGAELTNCSRCVFDGITNIRSQIIWSGGKTIGGMIDFDSASWGGLRNVRVQGYDSAATSPIQTPMIDGIEHLLRYTFIDITHVISNVHLVAGYSDVMVLETGGGENAIVNLLMTKLRLDNGGEGYLLRIDAGGGSKRIIQIDGLTIDNGAASGEASQPDTGGIIDASAITTGLAIGVSDARIEYNGQTNKVGLALFKLGSTGTSASSRSTVNLNNFVGYLTGRSADVPIVSVAKEDAVSVTENGGNFSLPLVRYEDTGRIVGAPGDRHNATVGLRVTQQPLGKISLLSGNFADRTTGVSFPILVKRGDIVYCEDQVCDYMVPDIAADDDSLYAYKGTGFMNAGRVIVMTSGSPIGALDPALPGGAGAVIGAAVQIAGAGAASGTLITSIVSIDRDALTITFADNAETSIAVATSISNIGAKWIRRFYKPRQSIPTGLGSDSAGTVVYVHDVGATVTWDGTRWMYSSDYAVTTANRPSYVNSVANRGLSVFDTDLGHSISWTGTVWVDGVGNTV